MNAETLNADRRDAMLMAELTFRHAADKADYDAACWDAMAEGPECAKAIKELERKARQYEARADEIARFREGCREDGSSNG